MSVGVEIHSVDGTHACVNSSPRRQLPRHVRTKSLAQPLSVRRDGTRSPGPAVSRSVGRLVPLRPDCRIDQGTSPVRGGTGASGERSFDSKKSDDPILSKPPCQP